MALPLPIIPTPKQRFWIIDATGVQPLVGSLSFFVAGTDTPEDVFADPNGDVSLGSVVNLDDDGYAPPIYLNPAVAYKVILYTLPDEGGAQIWEVDGVEDVGASWLDTYGVTQTEGSKDVTTGYPVTPADNLITVNELTTDPAIIVLESALDRSVPLTIKNMGPTTVAVTPPGIETIENIAAAFVLPAASSPSFPTITINSDGVSNYWIMSSHAL